MNLSDEDRERLDELARMRDNGELSNEEYQRLCWATLAEKNRRPGEGPSESPLFSQAPAGAFSHEEPRVAPSPVDARLSTGKPASLIELTTCNPGRSRSRLMQVRRNATGLCPNISMTQLFRLKGARTTSAHSMLFPRRGMSLSSMFLLLIVSILSTILVTSWLIAPPAPPEPEPKPEEVANDYIQPLFGSVAVKKCHLRCAGIGNAQSKSTCEQACRYLSLATYGQRITLTKKLDPQVDANEIFSRCTKREIAPTRYLEPDRWEKDMREAAGVLRSLPRDARLTSFEQAQKALDDLYRANHLLLMPPEDKAAGTEITKDMIRATCLRANLVLTEMAMMKAAQSKNDFSLQFYTALYQHLAPKTKSMEDVLLAQARLKELLEND